MDARLAIYPTARKVEDLLKRQSRPAPRLGHRVMTFPQLVDGLWRECATRPILLSAIGERLALEEAVSQSPARGQERLPAAPGLVDCLQGVIGELKSAALGPEDIREACRTLQGGAARRVSMLAAAYEQYQSLLQRTGLADRHDRERIVLEFLLEKEGAGQRPQFLQGVSELLVAEIYDFSLLQFMIVATLIRIIGDAKLTIQAEPHQVDVSRFAELTWNRFVGEESISDKVLPDFVRREGRPGQFGFVLQHLFVGAGDVCSPFDGTVRVIEAPTRYREVEEVGRAIRHLLEQREGERIALERIAVVARDLTPYVAHLERVFGRYRISLRFRRPRPLRAAPAAKFALDAVAIPLEGYRRESLDHLWAMLETPIAARRYRATLSDIGYMDRDTRPLADCIAQRRRELERALDAAEIDPSQRRRLTSALSQLDRAAPAMASLLASLGRLEAAGSVAAHVGRLREILRAFGVEPSGQLSGESAAGFGGLERALDEMARCSALIAPRRVLGLEEFAVLFQTTLSQSLLDSEPGPSSGVQALEVLDARGLDFDMVFIIGLCDGGFPLYRGEDPLLSDDVKGALNGPLRAALRRRFGANAPSAPGRILRTSRDRNSEDWFLFFLALSMAERRVVLTYPANDEKGNPLSRSPFVAEVLKLLDGGQRDASEIWRRASSERFIPAPGDCFARSEFLNCAAMGGSLDAGLAPTLGADDRLDWLNRRIEIEKRRQLYLSLPVRELIEGGAPDPRKLALVDSYDGRAAGGERLRRMLLRDPWSPTRLNLFAACGFKFFARHVLNLSPEEEPDYESSALETGTLAHRVLGELHAAEIDFSDRATALERARRLLATLRELERLNAREPAFFGLEWKNIERIVEEVVDFESAERARRAGPSQTLLEHPASLVLHDHRPLPDGERIELALEGRLDRLELYRDSSGRISKIRVLDYKTSRRIEPYANRADPAGDEFGLTEFQLAVYLMAVLEEFKDQLAPAVGLEAGYLVLRHWNKLQTSIVPLERVETDRERRIEIAARGLAASAADRAIELVASAIRGKFDVDPLRCDDWCAFRRVCRYEKPRQVGR